MTPLRITAPVEPIIRDIASQLAASVSELGFPVGMGIAPPEEMCLRAARGIAALYGKTLSAAPGPEGVTAGRRMKSAAELQDECDRLADQFTDLYGAAKAVTLAAWTDRHGRLHGHETVSELGRVLEGLDTQQQAREDVQPVEWKRTPSNHLFGRTIRPEDVDYLEAGSLLRFYSSDPWFDASGDMPTVGQIVRFTGNVERERFPAVAPHLEVAALDGRVYPGGGWQCHLFQFASPPDTAHALEGGAV